MNKTISQGWSDIVKCAKFICSCAGIPLCGYTLICVFAGRDLGWKVIDFTRNNYDTNGNLK